MGMGMEWADILRGHRQGVPRNNGSVQLLVGGRFRRRGSQGSSKEGGLSELKAVDPIRYREPEAYDRLRGSGWFWCLNGDGEWFACYINALWGARLDGRYVNPSSFRDVSGPIHPPGREAGRA